jgi:hypothetical protein
MPVVFRPIRSKESERRQWLVRLVASATLVNGLASIGHPFSARPRSRLSRASFSSFMPRKKITG